MINGIYFAFIGDQNSYDIIAVTILSIAENTTVPWLGIKSGLPWFETNALTTEPKSRRQRFIIN